MTNEQRLKTLRFFANHHKTAQLEGCPLEAVYCKYSDQWTLRSFIKGGFKIQIEVKFNSDGSYNRMINRTTLWSSARPTYVTEPEHVAELDELLERAVENTKEVTNGEKS